MKKTSPVCRVLVVLGTRPEAIKLAPLIRRLGQTSGTSVATCLTSQHRDLVRPVLEFFGIRPEFDLDIMAPGQALSDAANRVLRGVSRILAEQAFDVVVVQGDTTSALFGGLAAFYRQVPLAHVEAGLRSGDLKRPFPEEAHRRLLDILADYLFAPTVTARNHLLQEGAAPERIYVTGNTGIDALFQARQLLHRQPRPLPIDLGPGEKLVLLTTHRRESFGQPLRDILSAVRDLTRHRPEVRVLFPVHPNPEVRAAVSAVLRDCPRVHAVEPLDYPDFVQAMLQADLILTDSGGIQEEAPALGKRVLVLRDTTERPEGLDAGLAELVGTDRSHVLVRCLACLDNPQAADDTFHQLYGDGRACERIVAVLTGQASAAVTRRAA
ncbi:MAG: UDP-N-acetylglucosamine 2-epimerase (non-hydrolyzing) [Gemmataceae bacterium]|nr:UDP-N-acetylglucosamine 2-epimerase (non-hydrolyzing) [Gemmataceae bacterium]MDW8267361.1 UDP-N-acetylglucosamine 2-epimerase (non-hydrolyzing) [Gemmataceae bacterium]